jgi:16S rRNA (uracil1498-N3)-methyltransferase
MHRFYCRFSDLQDKKIVISDFNQLHHLKNVLRFKTGDKAVVFDDRGNEYSVRLNNLSEKEAEFGIDGKRSQDSDLGKVRITIACAIPKKSKIDDIIDRLTQLGVDRIIPVLTERVIVKMDKEKEIQRKKRWEKIALSASKQSQRNTIAVVDQVTDFAELISLSEEFDLKLIPNLNGTRKTLKSVLSGVKAQNVLVLIGPEGDFTPQEIALATKSGFVPVTFGDLVFRVETACLYIASILNYELRY